MKYSIVLARSAEKELKLLPKFVQEQVGKHLVALEANPRPPGIKKLRDREEYRLRVGNYRVLYTVNDTLGIVDVSVIEHRKEVYR